MIYRLQRKFVLISTASVLGVVALVFSVILILNITSMNKNLDILADQISDGGGIFPMPFDEFVPSKIQPENKQSFDFITSETPFATRHFTVFFDTKGNVKNTFTDSIYAITETEEVEYAEKVMKNGDVGGWIANYRYKIFSSHFGEGVVFVDGSMNRSVFMQSTTIA